MVPRLRNDGLFTSTALKLRLLRSNDQRHYATAYQQAKLKRSIASWPQGARRLSRSRTRKPPFAQNILLHVLDTDWLASGARGEAGR